MNKQKQRKTDFNNLKLNDFFNKSKQFAEQIIRNIKAKFKDIGGTEGVKKTFKDSGGFAGLKDKSSIWINDIKTGFTPDKGTTGSKKFTSRINNLWASSVAGKVTIIAVCLITFTTFASLSKQPQTKQNNFQTTDSTSSWEYNGNNNHPIATNNKQIKTKKLGVWVCNQCGKTVETKNIPHGRCPSRKNAPHSWSKKVK